MSEPTGWVDLAAERVGGEVLAANDEFFAEKENLLKEKAPIFIEDKYTEQGKWMDGWETRRRREPGYDWCIIKLGLTGIVSEIIVDTAHFKGNFPERCSVEAVCVDGNPTVDELLDGVVRWADVVPESPLEGDTKNVFSVDDPARYTHLRLNIFPDGGVARLRAHGVVMTDWTADAENGGEIDLAALANGGRIMKVSDAFFSPPGNMLSPGQGTGMHDGWETRRLRGPGNDWAIIGLAAPGIIKRVEVDTAYFKGNAPGSCSIESLDASMNAKGEILPKVSIGPDAPFTFTDELSQVEPVSFVRLNIFPDGGISRLRLWGTVNADAIRAHRLDLLNAAPEPRAHSDFLACCGSTRWAQDMVTARPFVNTEALLSNADRIWEAQSKEDWLEAFAAHPRIGDKKTPESISGNSKSGEWSKGEQSGTSDASQDVLESLRVKNEAYFEKFGFIYIVCATGKSADEMLALLTGRLQNDPEAELPVAAEEQRKITRIRLEKLLSP